MKQELRSINRRLGIKGQQPLTTPFPAAPSVPLRISSLSSLYGTPRCDGFHELQEIHVIVKTGYGLEFAYVILSYGIVLKSDDPSLVLKQGDSESKSNLTRTSQNVSAEVF
nr:hypothetical protein [Tanacetum cinerariifolium]